MNEQTRKVLHSSKKSDWCTPKELFDLISLYWGPFQIDAAVDYTNAKCELYFGKDESGAFCDGLKMNWNARVFCNPPYGRTVGKWIKKAANEAKINDCTSLLLVPARTGSRWFKDAIQEASLCVFLIGRVVFESSPGQPLLDKKGRPMAAPFNSVLLGFSPNKTDFKRKCDIMWWDWKQDIFYKP